MEYQPTIEINELLSSLLPYLFHFLIAIIQGLLALQFIIWGVNLMKLKGKGKLPQKVTIKFDFLNNSYGGLVLIFLGILIMSSFLFGFHYYISITAVLFVLILLIFNKVQPKLRLKRIILISLSLLVISFAFWEKEDPAKYSTYICFKALKWRIYETTWQEIYDKQAPKVGDLAPNFVLTSSDNKDTLELATYLGKKPIALIFGSHTCPPHSDGTVTINELYDRYKEEVIFINVYLAEAHPIDKWWLGESRTQCLIFDAMKTKALRTINEPKNIDERNHLAQQYREILFNNKIPIYVDQFDNKVSEMYAAKPTRIYLIDNNGRVIYNPGFGPASYNPQRLGIRIEKLLNRLNLTIPNKP